MSETGMSRRRFLTGTAVVAAAASMPLISAAESASAAPALTFPLLTVATPGWTPLDPKACAREAYEIYKGKRSGQSACCEATYWPVIGAIAAQFPDTAGLIPKGLFNYGGGGVAAWGASCGCTNGGTAALTQIGVSSAYIDQYNRWYETTALPSNACYLDYRSGTWTPGGTSGGVWGGTGLVIPLNNAPRSRAQSVLCHASVSQWLGVADGAGWITAGGSQSDRCGKLCYDAAYMMATIINAWKAGGTGDGTLSAAASSSGCNAVGCHDANSHHPSKSKMTCTSCHEQTIGDNHNL